MQTDDVRKILETCEFFNGLDGKQLTSIIPICRPCRFDAGETIYRQGGVGEEIFIIAEGQVMLERAVNVGLRKGTVPVAVLGKGKIIGGWSTLLDEPHTLMLSAVCRRPAVLLAINGVDVRQRMTDDIRLGFRILEKLCLIEDQAQRRRCNAVSNTDHGPAQLDLHGRPGLARRRGRRCALRDNRHRQQPRGHA